MPLERIHNIMIDYANGIVLINGKKVDFPFKVIVKEADGWDMSKLFNSGSVIQGGISTYPELIIDVRTFQEMTARQELKKIIREVIEEAPRQRPEAMPGS